MGFLHCILRKEHDTCQEKDGIRFALSEKSMGDVRLNCGLQKEYMQTYTSLAKLLFKRGYGL